MFLFICLRLFTSFLLQMVNKWLIIRLKIENQLKNQLQKPTHLTNLISVRKDMEHNIVQI